MKTAVNFFSGSVVNRERFKKIEQSDRPTDQPNESNEYHTNERRKKEIKIHNFYNTTPQSLYICATWERNGMK